MGIGIRESGNGRILDFIVILRVRKHPKNLILCKTNSTADRMRFFVETRRLSSGSLLRMTGIYGFHASRITFQNKHRSFIESLISDFAPDSKPGHEGVAEDSEASGRLTLRKTALAAQLPIASRCGEAARWLKRGGILPLPPFPQWQEAVAVGKGSAQHLDCYCQLPLPLNFQFKNFP